MTASLATSAPAARPPARVVTKGAGTAEATIVAAAAAPNSRLVRFFFIACFSLDAGIVLAFALSRQ